MPTTLESLARVPLFSGLSSRQMRKIVKHANEDHYADGDIILREGGLTRSLFVIVEGKANVVRDGRTIARRVAGEFFGEISMIDLRPRTASVVADGPVHCLVLPHDTLRDLVSDDPRVAWSLIETLASRLRDFESVDPG